MTIFLFGANRGRRFRTLLDSAAFDPPPPAAAAAVAAARGFDFASFFFWSGVAFVLESSELEELLLSLLPLELEESEEESDESDDDDDEDVELLDDLIEPSSMA